MVVRLLEDDSNWLLCLLVVLLHRTEKLFRQFTEFKRLGVCA